MSRGRDINSDHQALDKAKREGKEWLEKVMRLGFVAKGVVYFTIGILALQAAIGGGQTTGSEGALMKIASQPFGQILLGIIAVGLLGLTLWYFLRGIYDIDNKGDDATALAKRAFSIGSGIGYGLLAVFAFRILLGSGGGSGGSDTASWTARLMQESWGRWAVGIAGLVIIGIGLSQFYVAYKAKFRERLSTAEMSKAERTWGTRAGQFGIAARGVVVIIIGSFFVQAAWQYDPQEAGGFGEALRALAQQPFGPWLLAAVSLGLIAYGLFAAVVLARYRRIYLHSL